jgi:hypothetical protein
MPQLCDACLRFRRQETVPFVIEVAEPDVGVATQIGKGRADGLQTFYHLLDALQFAIVQNVHESEAFHGRVPEGDPGLSEFEQHAQRDRQPSQLGEYGRHLVFAAYGWANGPRGRRRGRLRRKTKASDDLVLYPPPHLDRCTANLIRRQRDPNHDDAPVAMGNIGRRTNRILMSINHGDKARRKKSQGPSELQIVIIDESGA